MSCMIVCFQLSLGQYGRLDLALFSIIVVSGLCKVCTWTPARFCGMAAVSVGSAASSMASFDTVKVFRAVSQMQICSCSQEVAE